MEEQPTPAGSRGSSLQETIVTLPVAAIVVLSIVTLGAIGAATALMLIGPESLHETAGKMLVVLLPMLFAIVAAIGIRRTSTRQIDELVARFLERTVRERLELACADHRQSGYPFDRAELVRRANGRSYVSYRMAWADGSSEPVQIAVKMNVYNIELVTQLSLDPAALPADAGPIEAGVEFIDRRSLESVRSHPLLRHFHGTLQGAVEEGYAIRVGLKPSGAVIRMEVSLRQKMQEHFLASSYLKRYFAEDISIAIGVIFNELRDSGLQAKSVPAGA